jgi:hypothetical protein
MGNSLKTQGQIDEEARVKALLARDRHDRALQAGGPLDPVAGEPKRVPPSDFVKARRAARSNGMPEQETEDTIGRLWAWGLLDGPLPNGDQNTIDADLLRDAGRRYAASYWRRYGPVSPRASHFEEMTGRSSGPGFTVIPDEERDRLAEERFQRRDQALRACKAKRVIDLVCVDGAGDNDPSFLVALMQGYPAETRQERIRLASAEAELGRGNGKEQRLAERRVADAKRALKRKLIETRIRQVPHQEVALIVLGLSELARIDRAEGLHRPKRGRPKKVED